MVLPGELGGRETGFVPFSPLFTSVSPAATAEWTGSQQREGDWRAKRAFLGLTMRVGKQGLLLSSGGSALARLCVLQLCGNCGFQRAGRKGDVE